jgi:hypothetical protein
MNIQSVAGDVVSGLKTSPMLLAVLMLNIVLVGGVGYFMIKFGEANAERMQLILQSCLPKQ